MHIAVHPHRFDIYEDIGCTPVTYNTLPAYFLFFMWPVVIGTISFVYSALNLRSFYIRRAQFSTLVASSAMNTSRYLRLMILAFVDIMFTIPLGVYVIYIGTHGVPLQPWISWEETHFEFWRVRLIPALFWRSNPTLQTSVELNRWLCVLCAFLFFALFGFASEAKKNYNLAFWWVAGKFGFQPRTNSPPAKTPRFSLPKFKLSLKSSVDSNDALPVHATPNDRPPKVKGIVSGFSSFDIDLDSFTDKATGPASPSTPSTSSAPPPYTQSRHFSTRSFVSLPDTDVSHTLDHRVSTTSIYYTSYAASISTIHCDTPTQPNSPDACGTESSSLASPPLSAPIPAYHRPFSPPNTYPITQPHGGAVKNSIEPSSTNPFEAL
ncbi:a-factor receptor [Paramarasmius palmivorus]|uniref:A-factor receptor n=1 Tax=Paramarasmius palmivorus TaxID=297713 RepID=A0AAW0D472_9AGAR